MAYPTLEQYNEALQSPQLVLQDPELKQGLLKKTGLGLPLALCGGFALTYTVDVGTKRYALRCFHKESRELEHRYHAIATRLKQLNSPYFLPFEFNPNGIRIQGRTYPIVKMAWAKGKTLAEFLESEHRNTAALQRLRQALGSLASYLEQNQIAHGDIQPENVMVSSDGGSVQLIDYDGMYVDSLKGAKATELGQVNFQHPQRTADQFSPHLDRFSFLTLDVALQALIASASLWNTSRSEPSAVVFRRNDFLDPGASSVFQDSVRLPNLKTHVEGLAKVATGAFASIPALADFLQGRGISAGPILIRPKSLGAAAYQGAYTICDATNFEQVLKQVGNRIELIGRVHSVKKGWAQNRKPYVFVNFSDWRGKAIKLAIWGDGMDAIKPLVPDDSWIGRWLSVTGLVDPPFSNKVRSTSYTHLSITVSAKGQIQQLPEQEATFRLGATSRPAAPSSTASSRNSTILDGMGGSTSHTRSPSPIRSPSTPVKSSNQHLLDSMRRQAQGAGVTPPQPSRQPVPPPQHQPHPRNQPASNSGCLPVVILAIAGLSLIRTLFS